MSAYDDLVELLAQFEQRPYAMMMGRRDLTELRRDPRARRVMSEDPGEYLCFMKVPIRVERCPRGRLNGTPNRFSAKVFATAEDLHEAIYGEQA